MEFVSRIYSYLNRAIVLLTAGLTLNSTLTAGTFQDDFSANTSADYIYTDTYGTGGSFAVSGGTQNLTSARGNTAIVFHKTAQLAAGELVRVTVPAGTAYDFYLTASTTTRSPNTGSEDGIRWQMPSSNTLRARTYRNGSATSTSYTGIGSIWTGDLTLLIYRDTNTQYRVGYDVGSGPVIVDIITISETASDDGLFIGVEGYGASTRKFDNLEIRTIGASYPSIVNFTASTTIISKPGEVTFTWSAENEMSATLNGQDVTGQSPLTLTVNQSGDYTLVITGDNGFKASQTIKISVGESFRIAAVADPQYADADPRGSREPRESVARLNNAISNWNQRDLDWGVILGDIIDWDDINYSAFPGSTTTVAPQDWSNTEAILGAWDQLSVPGYLVLGNHDYYVPHEDTDGLKKPHSVYRAFGFKDKAYYSFRHKGFKFIVLEGDNSHLNYAEGTQEYTTAKTYFDTNIGSPWWNAGILTPQLIWMMKELDASLLVNEPVVIMCHYPVHNAQDTGHSLYNANEVTTILDGYRNVVLWLNGHNHGGGYAQMGWRHHLNLKGMQEEGDRWYEIAFSQNEALVYQAENTTDPVFNLDISRPIYPLPRPMGFTVSESSGSSQLSWNADPAGVTEVIVEARQVSTAGPWHNLTTLTSPSGGTYLDTASSPVADYKYRIRFQSGSDLSPYSQALGVGEYAGVTYSEFIAGLGAAAQFPSDDADGDGRANVLEQFLGTNILQPDAAPDREPRISESPTGEIQLVFSHDAASIHKWDLSMSFNLDSWQAMLRDVDYCVVSNENWSPTGDSESYNRVTLKLLNTRSRNLAELAQPLFIRLELTPAQN